MPARPELLRALLVGALALASGAAGASCMLIAQLPLAGSQYHALAQVRTQLAPGTPLLLRREPGNRHDPQAIRVEWQGYLLGYVPRRFNRALAAALAAGQPLQAWVTAIQPAEDPWQRLELAVCAAL